MTSGFRQRLGTMGVAFCAIVALQLTLAGCNRTAKLPVEQGVIVKAKILKGGQPLPVKDESGIPGMELVQPYQISLIPVGASVDVHQRGEYVGLLEPDGLVRFVGPGKGIPPGDYKMAIVGNEVAAEGDNAARDPFGGRYSAENTPLQYTIKVENVGKEQDLGTIDLDHPPK